MVLNLELGHHLVVADDRAGNELREEENEKAVTRKTRINDLPSISVHDPGNLLKGVEADGQRKDEAETGDVGACDRIHIQDKEIRILEESEKPHIEKNAEREKEF